ncbi:MAG: hypothetical protein WC947_10940 [Elusimicrobiota bacterium]
MNLPKWLKVTFFVVLAVVYLNIGYEYSERARGIVQKHSADTFIENVISGGWNVFFATRKGEYGIDDHILSLIFWPILLCISLFVWIIFACCQFLIFFWEGIQFLWWFIFCGGLYKMIGMSGIMGIVLILAGFFSYLNIVKSWKKILK